MTLCEAFREAVKAEIELALASITPGADGYLSRPTQEREAAEEAWRVLSKMIEHKRLRKL